MIRIKNVSKIYRTEHVETHALSGFSLHVEPGEFLSVMGHRREEVRSESELHERRIQRESVTIEQTHEQTLGAGLRLSDARGFELLQFAVGFVDDGVDLRKPARIEARKP